MKYRRNSTVLIQITVCACFLVLPYLFSPETDFGFWITTPPGKRDLIAGLLLIGFFYLNYFVFLPRFYFTHRKLVFFGLVSISYVVIGSIPGIVTRHFIFEMYRPIQGDYGMPFNPVPPPPGHKMLESILSGPQFFLFLVVFLFSMGLAINERWRLAEKERIRAELHNLKAQINPHFLFNAMNGIYSLTLEKSNQAPEAVLQLSSMLRYVFGRDSQHLVPLVEEIEYISHYIALQRLRFGNRLGIDYSVEGSPSGKIVAPMIFVPLIENAFKHGVNPDAESMIRISIKITDDQIGVETLNNKVPKSIYLEKASGIGIPNTRSRLALLYAGHHELVIEENDRFFKTKMTIQWKS